MMPLRSCVLLVALTSVYVTPAVANPIFHDDFEHGDRQWQYANEWGITGLAGHSPTHSLNNEQGETARAGNTSVLTLRPSFGLVVADADARLEFWAAANADPVTPDDIEVEISANGGTTWSSLYRFGRLADWTHVSLPLAAFVGNPLLRLRVRAVYRDVVSSNHDFAALDDVVIDDGITALTVTDPAPTTIVRGGATRTVQWGYDGTAGEPASFTVDLSTNGGSSFGSPIASGLAGTARSATWAVAPTDGDVVLRVRAFDAHGVVLATALSGRVTVDATGPTPFALLGPTDNACTNGAPLLCWDATADNPSTLAGYQLWVDGVLDTDHLSPTTNCATPVHAALGTHRWYVVAIDGLGNSTRSNDALPVHYDDFEHGAPDWQLVPQRLWDLCDPTGPSCAIDGHGQLHVYGSRTSSIADTATLRPTFDIPAAGAEIVWSDEGYFGAGTEAYVDASRDGATWSVVQSVTDRVQRWSALGQTVSLASYAGVRGLHLRFRVAYQYEYSDWRIDDVAVRTVTDADAHFTVGATAIAQPPAIVSPADGTTQVARAPTLTWSAATGSAIASYTVMWDGNIVAVLPGTARSYALAPSEYVGRHTWSVFATDACGATATAATAAFVLHNCVPGTVSPCDGGFSSVGACRTGTYRCSDTGAIGACEGQVGPRSEVCNDADDDCDGEIDGPRVCYGSCALAGRRLPAGTPCGTGMPCHVPSQCDGVSPACVDETVVADGTECPSADPCQRSTCGSGYCFLRETTECTDAPCAHATGCDPVTHACRRETNADGTTCNVNVCTTGTCRAGSCENPMVSCASAGECYAATCVPAFGCLATALPSGTPCTGGRCESGACISAVVDAGPSAPDASVTDAITPVGDAASDVATVVVDTGIADAVDAAATSADAAPEVAHATGCSCRAPPGTTSPRAMFAMAVLLGFAAAGRRRIVARA